MSATSNCLWFRYCLIFLNCPLIQKLSVISKLYIISKLSTFSLLLICPLFQNTIFRNVRYFKTTYFSITNSQFCIIFSGILGSRITANVETTWKLRIRIFLSRRLAIHATLNNVHSIHRQFATHGVGFRRRFTSRFSIFVIH